MYKLKEKMKAGIRVYGSAIISSSPKWYEVVKNANLDFVFLDTEHIPLGRETLATMCTTYVAMGIPPIVRIPSPDPYLATTTLDGGAVGILAPYIENVDEVKQLVGAVKYRPLKGKKLKKILDGEEVLNENMKKYIDERCKNNMLFINIESKPAVDSLRELLSVPGLDGVIIGPHDLSCSYSIPEEYTNTKFDEIVNQIIQECKKQNIGIGIHLSEEPEHQVKWAKAGVNIILHSSDISLFGKILNKEISQIKTDLGDGLNSENPQSTLI